MLPVYRHVPYKNSQLPANSLCQQHYTFHCSLQFKINEIGEIWVLTFDVGVLSVDIQMKPLQQFPLGYLFNSSLWHEVIW